MRLSEERIVVFPARSPRASVERAKRLGRQAELRYDSGHRLRFVGILQLMELGVECAPGEVWWEFRRRRRARERARTLVPAEKTPWVFTDLTSKRAGQRGGASANTGEPSNKRIQPTARKARRG